jgi:hypothetical protein
VFSDIVLSSGLIIDMWYGANGRDLVGSALRNVGLAPAGEFRNPPLVSQILIDSAIADQ